MELLQARDRKWKAFLLVVLTEMAITIGLAFKYVLSDSASDGLIGALISAFSAMNATLTIYMTHNVIQKKVVGGSDG